MISLKKKKNFWFKEPEDRVLDNDGTKKMRGGNHRKERYRKRESSIESISQILN